MSRPIVNLCPIKKFSLFFTPVYNFLKKKKKKKKKLLDLLLYSLENKL